MKLQQVNQQVSQTFSKWMIIKKDHQLVFQIDKKHKVQSHRVFNIMVLIKPLMLINLVLEVLQVIQDKIQVKQTSNLILF